MNNCFFTNSINVNNKKDIGISIELTTQLQNPITAKTYTWPLMSEAMVIVLEWWRCLQSSLSAVAVIAVTCSSTWPSGCCHPFGTVTLILLPHWETWPLEVKRGRRSLVEQAHGPLKPNKVLNIGIQQKWRCRRSWILILTHFLINKHAH